MSNLAFTKALEAFIRSRKFTDDGWLPPANINAYLVGSRAKGCARQGSDWDVLVTYANFISFDKRAANGGTQSILLVILVVAIVLILLLSIWMTGKIRKRSLLSMPENVLLNYLK